MTANEPHPAVHPVTEVWAARYAASTYERMVGIVNGFVGRLDIQGPHHLGRVTAGQCEEFLYSPTKRDAAPSPSTVRQRRWTLQALFATALELDVVIDDPAADLPVPSSGQRRFRPITAAELDLVWQTAMSRVRDPHRSCALVGLAEATATTGELARIRWRHINLNEGTVEHPGADPVQPRTGRLTTWAVLQLTALHRQDNAETDDLVVLRGGSEPTSQPAQASMSRMLGRLLYDAGITGNDVSPSSIRLHHPARLLAEGAPITEVALMLGLSGLDRTADLLEWDWDPR
jgi:integrase/recombinase XerC